MLKHMRKWAFLPVFFVLPLAAHCGGDDPVSADVDGGSPTATSSTSSPGEDGATKAPTPLDLPKTSAGCGAPASPSPAKGVTKTVKVDGKDRSYVLFVPKGYDPNRAYPLVAVFHGLGATGAQMAEFVKMQEYSAGNAVVVFPDGAGGKWDTTGGSDLAFFDALQADVEKSTCINRQREMALGFSFGAYMVNHLGCARSAKVRAIVAADGGFSGDGKACGKTAALVYHRTEDDDEPIKNGQRARDIWVGIDGCSSTTKPVTSFGFDGLGCVAYDGCAGTATPVVWCEDAAKSPYKHDLRDVYREPIWKWMDAFQ